MLILTHVLHIMQERTVYVNSGLFQVLHFFCGPVPIICVMIPVVFRLFQSVGQYSEPVLIALLDSSSEIGLKSPSLLLFFLFVLVCPNITMVTRSI
jgi:hypothetical protein